MSAVHGPVADPRSVAARGARRVAVIGAGLAGAACARGLADAGWAVQVFDKSRGVGGRLATRRAEWAGPDGQPARAAFDHGAPGFGAQSADFLAAVRQAADAGLVARWTPAVSPRGYAPLDEPALWVPVPDMPTWCRRLLSGLPLGTGATIDALQSRADGWAVQAAGADLARGFDAVVLALPLPQAAPLLRPHQPEWAQRAQATAMVPAWVLMGASAEPAAGAPFDLAWPTGGPLGWIVRNDAKPGRPRQPGVAHWVLHATTAWSRTHLESPAADVQARLQAALADWLGQPIDWLHVAVHRWRYASAPRGAAQPGRCWWDVASGLGVCADALAGAGVEGAWLSGRALAQALLAEPGAGRPPAADDPASPAGAAICPTPTPAPPPPRRAGA